MDPGTVLPVHMKGDLIEATDRRVIKVTGNMETRIMATKIMEAMDKIETATGGIARRMKYHHGLVMKMQKEGEEWITCKDHTKEKAQKITNALKIV